MSKESILEKAKSSFKLSNEKVWDVAEKFIEKPPYSGLSLELFIDQFTKTPEHAVDFLRAVRNIWWIYEKSQKELSQSNVPPENSESVFSELKSQVNNMGIYDSIPMLLSMVENGCFALSVDIEQGWLKKEKWQPELTKDLVRRIVGPFSKDTITSSTQLNFELLDINLNWNSF